MIMELPCNFTTSDSFSFNSGALICAVVDDFKVTIPNSTIYKVTEPYSKQRFKNKNPKNISGIEIDAKVVRYFPKGLEKIFKALEIILITDSRLREIHQHDLWLFRQLKYLNLKGNRIKVIQRDTFKFNYDLEVIILRNNQIKDISNGNFDKLNYLVTLDLFNNLCISNGEDGDHEDVLDLIREIHIKCDNSSMIYPTCIDYTKNFNQIKVLNFCTLALLCLILAISLIYTVKIGYAKRVTEIQEISSSSFPPAKENAYQVTNVTTRDIRFQEVHIPKSARTTVYERPLNSSENYASKVVSTGSSKESYKKVSFS